MCRQVISSVYTLRRSSLVHACMPAASFRDIVRAIVKDTKEILPVAAPTKFEGLPEPVCVSVPLQLGSSIGSSIYDTLSVQEKRGIREAAEAIYQTFKTAS